MGRAGDPNANFCGGGVGSALGGIMGEPSTKEDLLDGPGEKGGVGAGGLGVDPLERTPGVMP